MTSIQVREARSTGILKYLEALWKYTFLCLLNYTLPTTRTCSRHRSPSRAQRIPRWRTQLPPRRPPNRSCQLLSDSPSRGQALKQSAHKHRMELDEASPSVPRDIWFSPWTRLSTHRNQNSSSHTVQSFSWFCYRKTKPIILKFHTIEMFKKNLNGVLQVVVVIAG